jgi:UDP-2,4-diacetamido-2,4,6-trideoxy-beta-L-altropyranose hydrolase
MSQTPHVLFVVDAGPAVGGGHVMRCLSLAAALAERGATCAFAAPPAVQALLRTFAPDTDSVTATSTDPAALAEAAYGSAFDAVVMDHYGLADVDHRRIAGGRPALVIDDLADRPLAANLVLDAGPHRRTQDYDALAPAGAGLLLGPGYAPLRPEFAAQRAAALARRGGPVRRILVALGLTDVNGVTSRVLDRLRPRLGDVAVDVVLGEAAQSRTSLERLARRDPRLTVHVDVTDMARLTAQADMAIGAAGSSTWERCVLGLPSVLLVLADNQRPAAAAMAEAEAALVVDAAAGNFESAFDRAAVRLLADAGLRARLSANSAAICDGLGAGRAAEAFLQVIAACDATSHPLPY